ncbi:uncharacterized protein MCYG_00405 [Microsporum canis CBS 113480]|uniref:Uncharacterized protein n=1 Tax=Arthroderma otae (strain ATCC MYA-4605 / CBS 113480) TaxID=554155 RepID=C5FC94_ARTOC|nr:uncharacterized protein MCYG_00405 [Microsporum canis CBS 113480]EEQ27517.1 predicted protein [Microsporum canis CBS 113480]
MPPQTEKRKQLKKKSKTKKHARENNEEQEKNQTKIHLGIRLLSNWLLLSRFAAVQAGREYVYEWYIAPRGREEGQRNVYRRMAFLPGYITYHIFGFTIYHNDDV